MIFLGSILVWAFWGKRISWNDILDFLRLTPQEKLEKSSSRLLTSGKKNPGWWSIRVIWPQVGKNHYHLAASAASAEVNHLCHPGVRTPDFSGLDVGLSISAKHVRGWFEMIFVGQIWFVCSRIGFLFWMSTARFLSRVCRFSCYSKLPRRLEYVIQPSKWRCQTFLGKFERWARISEIVMNCCLWFQNSILNGS